jgi:hypothetical protein
MKDKKFRELLAKKLSQSVPQEIDRELMNRIRANGQTTKVSIWKPALLTLGIGVLGWQFFMDQEGLKQSELDRVVIEQIELLEHLETLEDLESMELTELSAQEWKYLIEGDA